MKTYALIIAIILISSPTFAAECLKEDKFENIGDLKEVLKCLEAALKNRPKVQIGTKSFNKDGNPNYKLGSYDPPVASFLSQRIMFDEPFSSLPRKVIVGITELETLPGRKDKHTKLSVNIDQIYRDGFTIRINRREQTVIYRITVSYVAIGD